MTRFAWLQLVADRFFHHRPQRTCRFPQQAAARRHARPGLEVLEDRTVPAVFNVGAGDVNALIADINAANNNGQSNVINLTASTYDLTTINNYWYGPDGLPAISSNLTIHGNGATIQRDPSSGMPAFRLFYVSGGMELAAGSLTMDTVTLQFGIAKGGDSNLGGGGLGAGGAIFNQGTLNLKAVTLTGNEAVGGNSGITSSGNGGGGMGGDADSTGNGGGFGGSLGGTFGGTGGQGSTTGGNGAQGGGGGGGGFVTGANGSNANGVDGGAGGGLGDFGGTLLGGLGGDGGSGGNSVPGTGNGGNGGNFGSGGAEGTDGGGGGGGGVGGGGGFGNDGGNGGFGGGGGAFGSGGGGFGGGNGSLTSGGGGAGLGGAIFTMGADSAHPGSGQATLINCTLVGNNCYSGLVKGGNSGSAYGGAVFNLDGQVTLTNDTVAKNTVSFGGISPGSIDGGAVYNLAFGNDIDTSKAVTATLVLNNSILADSFFFNNSNGHDLVSNVVNGSNINTATVSGNHNLVMASSGNIGAGVIALTANPNLGQLQNNGGLTQTMLPLPGSPVLGAGDPSLAPSTDQRGQPRPANGPTDLGAVQVSVASTGGGSSGAVSAGLVGLAIEQFELTVDTVLVLTAQILGQSHTALDASIAQLQSAISNDPLMSTFPGQVVRLIGETAAITALSSR